MRTTAALLVAAVGSLLAGGLLRAFVGYEVGMGVVALGLLLLVAAIANSYLNDVREGYRSAGED